MFKIKKSRALSAVPVVVILMLCGVAVSIIAWRVSMNVEYTAEMGTYDAYETLTGDSIDNEKHQTPNGVVGGIGAPIKPGENKGTDIKYPEGDDPVYVIEYAVFAGSEESSRIYMFADGDNWKVAYTQKDMSNATFYEFFSDDSFHPEIDIAYNNRTPLLYLEGGNGYQLLKFMFYYSDGSTDMYTASKTNLNQKIPWTYIPEDNVYFASINFLTENFDEQSRYGVRFIMVDSTPMPGAATYEVATGYETETYFVGDYHGLTYQELLQNPDLMPNDLHYENGALYGPGNHYFGRPVNINEKYTYPTVSAELNDVIQWHEWDDNAYVVVIYIFCDKTPASNQNVFIFEAMGRATGTIMVNSPAPMTVGDFLFNNPDETYFKVNEYGETSFNPSLGTIGSFQSRYMIIDVFDCTTGEMVPPDAQIVAGHIYEVYCAWPG